MSKEALTATYRPQTFTQVAGQQAIKTILSRAAAEDRIAPAYLFSGTRGVGKTTIARIFAKAVNCQDAPTAEPCNACRFCDQITKGSSVDVMEIDGASNTGVDNVRKLQENVAYAPLDCRYKVVIIDEAHMLSKQAFNALLKTLEEPPGHVVFIMATTEPEKFPQTIISRCQHYVFKRLPQKELVEHLSFVLDQEAIAYEVPAVHLVARRGAGSVRDAMSLLGQVLALGEDGLRLRDVREVLGLAHQELYLDLVRAIAEQDVGAISRVQTEILDKGLDLIFFLRELVLCWRHLFLLLEMGDVALELIDLPQEEAEAWKACAPLFSPAHVHACWQMTLEGQRKVQTSLEPGLDLEMLLVNLSYLPSLLPLGKIPSRPSTARPAKKFPVPEAPSPESIVYAAEPKAPYGVRPVDKAPGDASKDASREFSGKPSDHSKASSSALDRPKGAAVASSSMTHHEPASTEAEEPKKPEEPARQEYTPSEPSASSQVSSPATSSSSVPPSSLDWEGFVTFCQENAGEDGQVMFLKRVEGRIKENCIRIVCPQDFVYQQCSRQKTLARLTAYAAQWAKQPMDIVVEPPREDAHPSHGDVQEKALADPLVKEVMDSFAGAKIVTVVSSKGPCAC